MENKEKKGIFVRVYDWFASLTMKSLVGAILVVFIIIIILMSVSFLPGIMSRISSSLSAALYSIFVPAENATMTIDKSIINSGENIYITFKKGDVTNGLFSVSYACDPSVELLSVENSGFKKIDCDNRYYLLENESAIKIRPITQEGIVRLVIEGNFENNETQKIDKVGVVRVTIKNDSAGTIFNLPEETTPVITESSTPTPYIPAPTPIQPIYYGKPDLAIRVLQVGLLNQYTNQITTYQNQFSNQDMIGIKFEVRNDGDANTGQWNFTAILPSYSTPTFNSNTQVSLKPGESIVFTLGFGNLANQTSNQITINVDPQNYVGESNETNNFLTSTITNNNYNSYNNNGCYINGVFTYNCLNNNTDYNSLGYYDSYGNYIYYNNNSWNNNYNYNNLTVSCYADPNDPETGDKVHWYAKVYGGDNDYDYEWTGTNNLESSAKNPTKTYNSRGLKYATVIVDSASYRATATCSVYVD